MCARIKRRWKNDGKEGPKAKKWGGEPQYLLDPFEKKKTTQKNKSKIHLELEMKEMLLEDGSIQADELKRRLCV